MAVWFVPLAVGWGGVAVYAAFERKFECSHPGCCSWSTKRCEETGKPVCERHGVYERAVTHLGETVRPAGWYRLDVLERVRARDSDIRARIQAEFLRKFREKQAKANAWRVHPRRKQGDGLPPDPADVEICTPWGEEQSMRSRLTEMAAERQCWVIYDFEAEVKARLGGGRLWRWKGKIRPS